MRKTLLLLAFAALVAGCGVSSPFSPDDSGSLEPAGQCGTSEQNPC